MILIFKKLLFRLYQLVNSILDLPNEVNKVVRTVDEVVEFIHEYGGYRLGKIFFRSYVRVFVSSLIVFPVSFILFPIKLIS